MAADADLLGHIAPGAKYDLRMAKRHQLKP